MMAVEDPSGRLEAVRDTISAERVIPRVRESRMAMLKQVNRRVSQLEGERESTLAVLAKLENAENELSPQGSIELIDCLPLGNFEMAPAPEAFTPPVVRGLSAEDPLQQAN